MIVKKRGVITIKRCVVGGRYLNYLEPRPDNIHLINYIRSIFQMEPINKYHNKNCM